jgi:hypothetical protein
MREGMPVLEDVLRLDEKGNVVLHGGANDLKRHITNAKSYVKHHEQELKKLQATLLILEKIWEVVCQEQYGPLT